MVKDKLLNEKIVFCEQAKAIEATKSAEPKSVFGLV